MNTDVSNGRSEVAAEVEAAYSEWSGTLSRFLVGLCGNREDAEDVLVETFVQAYSKWSTFKGAGSRRNWLYGIAANRARMSRRKSRPTLERLDDETPMSGLSPLDLVATRQEILKLPPGQREVFLLVKGERLTAREAAESLGRPIGTVLYEVSRAMNTLKEALCEKDVPIKAPQAQCQTEP